MRNRRAALVAALLFAPSGARAAETTALTSAELVQLVEMVSLAPKIQDVWAGTGQLPKTAKIRRGGVAHSGSVQFNVPGHDSRIVVLECLSGTPPLLKGETARGIGGLRVRYCMPRDRERGWVASVYSGDPYQKGTVIGKLDVDGAHLRSGWLHEGPIIPDRVVVKLYGKNCRASEKRIDLCTGRVVDWKNLWTEEPSRRLEGDIQGNPGQGREYDIGTRDQPFPHVAAHVIPQISSSTQRAAFQQGLRTLWSVATGEHL